MRPSQADHHPGASQVDSGLPKVYYQWSQEARISRGAGPIRELLPLPTSLSGGASQRSVFRLSGVGYLPHH